MWFKKNKKEPLVSILMPAYNSERYIETAIKSVLAQSYKDWELLIVDDGSEDETKEIINAFHNQDKRIRVISNKKRLGIPKSRNIGLRKSRGSLCCHLDSDDYIRKDAIKKMVKMFKKKNSALIYSKYSSVDERGKLIRKEKAPRFSRRKIANIGWQHFGMYKRDIALAVGGFNEALITCSDGDLFVKIAKKYPCKRYNRYLYFYRWHDKNIGHSRPKCYECKKKKVCNYFKEWNKG
jgi:glycosyltransferase involved in cell wall biosynthesis